MSKMSLLSLVVLACVAGVTNAALAEDAARMVVVVDYSADADHFERLKTLVEGVARASILEAGCRRFDVVAPAGAPDHLTLYEVFDDKAAFAVHTQTAAFKQFAADSSSLGAVRVAVPGTMVLSLQNP